MSLEFIDVETGLPLLEKTVNETRRYYVDFTEKLRNSTISGLTTVTAVPLGRIASAAALNIPASGIDGDAVYFSLSGGTAGEVYRITAKVTDTNGQVLEGSGALLLTSY